MIVQILANGLWQGVIICAAAGIVVRAFSRDSAATRCAVWFIALLAIALVPVITVVWPLHLPAFDSSVSSGTPDRVRVTLIALSTAADRSWVLWPLVSVWLCGVAVSLLRLSLSALRIERIRYGAAPVIVNGAAVLSSRDIATPIAAGVLSPAVILPHDLVDKLEPDDVIRVLAHERAHIARKDVLANYVQRLVEAALWFNPLVYLIGHELIKEREAACDDAAVSATGASHEYAACLATLARSIAQSQTPLTSPSVFGSRPALVNRIERLLASDELPKPALNRYAVVAVAAGFIALTALLQGVAPAFAFATPATGVTGSEVAAACAPVDAVVVNPAMPDVPRTAHPKRPTLIKVLIGADGKVRRIDMVQSSGDEKADEAAARAAVKSTYKPAMKNCKAVAGMYLFQVAYAPG